jgi:hypothetical protein
MSTQPTPAKLFVDTGASGDVVLNWHGHPPDKLYLYANEYHCAARRLVERSSAQELRDIGSCPVVFLYRHSLELLLKDILMTGLPLRHGSPQAKSIVELGHDLKQLCGACETLLKEVSLWAEWRESFDTLGTVISEFASVDVGSFSFRYPIAKDGTSASLRANRQDSGFAFDLKHFCQTMDELLRVLHGLACEVEVLVQRSQDGP